jgi:hypothetical protein
MSSVLVSSALVGFGWVAALATRLMALVGVLLVSVLVRLRLLLLVVVVLGGASARRQRFVVVDQGSARQAAEQEGASDQQQAKVPEAFE